MGNVQDENGYKNSWASGKTLFKLSKGKKWLVSEALSAGMQICIDQFAGIGFGVEEGWQCAITILLHWSDMVNANADGNLSGGYSNDDSNVSRKIKFDLLYRRLLKASYRSCILRT